MMESVLVFSLYLNIEGMAARLCSERPGQPFVEGLSGIGELFESVVASAISQLCHSLLKPIYVRVSSHW